MANQAVVSNQNAIGRAAPRGVNATGQVVYLGMNTASTAQSATTGSASALPTDPAGYVMAVVGGVTVKIPYYNV